MGLIDPPRSEAKQAIEICPQSRYKGEDDHW